VGNVTSGGTESCLLAVKTARDLWRRAGGVGTPRLLAPVTVHAAFHKAAEYLGLELDLVPVEASGAVDAGRFAARLGPDVALAVVSAPSYPHAALDPVAEIAAAAAEAGVSLHVDACIGGLVLPFWHGADGELPPWDLRVPGVTSISADLHKFGYAPQGVSVLLHRGRDRHRAQYFATTGWPGYPVVNPTILGSKSAGALAAAWAIIRALGAEGFAELAARCQDATASLAATIDGIEGLRVVGRPVGPLLAVAADDGVAPEARVDPHHWADAARRHGWILQSQPGLAQCDGTRLPATTHLTITPVTAGVLAPLGAALVAAADEVRGRPSAAVTPLLGALAGLAGGDAPLDSATAGAVLAGLGLGGTGGGSALPDKTAPLLALIEAVPAPLAERLLTELLARLVEPGAR
ncbi:MAG: aminotransferase class V-fold PLP-dependent enzyme, partial [Microbacteriaceae bacterium]